MYSYKSAVVKQKLDWKEIDISNIPVDTLFKEYQEVRVRVDHFAMTSPSEFDLLSLKEFKNYPDTIITLLTSLGNKSLPTYRPFTNIGRKDRVEYRNSGLAGYNPKPCMLLIPGDVPLERTACDDILLPPLEGTTVGSLHEGCIFSVGGRVHRAYPREDGVVLKDGLKTMDRNEVDSLGIINLGSLGKVSYLDITEDSLKVSAPIINNFKELVYIGTDSIDLTKHYPFLVIAGLMLPLDTVTVIGQALLKVVTSDIPFMHLYLNAKNVLDLDGLRETITEENNESIGLLLSNAGIGKLLTDPSSFVILVEKEEGKELCLTKSLYQHSGTRGLYRDSIPPAGLLFNDAGLLANFVTVPNNDKFSISTNDDIVNNWLMSGREQSNNDKVISTMRERHKPFRYSNLTCLTYYHLY